MIHPYGPGAPSTRRARRATALMSPQSRRRMIVRTVVLKNRACQLGIVGLKLRNVAESHTGNDMASMRMWDDGVCHPERAAGESRDLPCSTRGRAGYDDLTLDPSTPFG